MFFFKSLQQDRVSMLMLILFSLSHASFGLIAYSLLLIVWRGLSNVSFEIVSQADENLRCRPVPYKIVPYSFLLTGACMDKFQEYIFK